MNPRSDVDFSSPKVDLMVNLSEVAIELNRPQVGVHGCDCVVYKHVCVKETHQLKLIFFGREEQNKVRGNLIIL